MSAQLLVMAAWAPFAIDDWPRCEPWQRAGKVTLWDRVELEHMAARADRQLRLEIDRRFDVLLDRLREQARPALG